MRVHIGRPAYVSAPGRRTSLCLTHGILYARLE